VIPVLDPPVIGGFISPPAYVVGGPPVFLAETATVTDADSENYGSGLLSIRWRGNAQSTDRLSIFHEGNGPGQISISGQSVLYGGVLIGTFTGGNGTTPLVISLTSAATPNAVQAVLRRITFHSIASVPSALPRSFQISLKILSDLTQSNLVNGLIDILL
jgi:hypothetical protein